MIVRFQCWPMRAGRNAPPRRVWKAPRRFGKSANPPGITPTCNQPGAREAILADMSDSQATAPRPTTANPRGEVMAAPPRRKAQPPGPCAMVIFGAGGDLTKRLLVPALYNL